MLQEGWYALYVKSRSELAVACLLTGKGYEPFVPMSSGKKKTHGSERVQKPLFPNYIFCRGTGQSVGKIVTTPCVIKIIGAGNVPIPVEQFEIDNLMKIEAARLNGDECSPPKLGEEVEISTGPLCG